MFFFSYFCKRSGDLPCVFTSNETRLFLKTHDEEGSTPNNHSWMFFYLCRWYYLNAICINTICNSIIQQSLKHIPIMYADVHKEQHTPTVYCILYADDLVLMLCNHVNPLILQWGVKGILNSYIFVVLVWWIW